MMRVSSAAIYSASGKSRTKEFLTCSVSLAVLSWAAGFGQPAQAQSLPTGGSVASGSVTISQPLATGLTISQSSATGIVNWSSFSIGQGYQVQFNNGAGATFNRVTGNVPSSINGLLSATGSVYLVNPAGITVGKNGVINAGGSFVASTLDAKDADVRAGGSLTFRGDSKASVVNFGRIGSAQGDIVLIARQVRNDGALSARNGTVALASGSEVVLSDGSLGNGKVLVRLPAQNGEVVNTGRIRAAEVELRANGGNVYALAGNTGRTIKATGFANRGGRVFLTAQGGSVTVTQKVAARRTQATVASAPARSKTTKTRAPYAGGDVVVSGDAVTVGGTIDVAGNNGSGGTAVVTGADITLTSRARIDAGGTSGGTVLIGGDRAGGSDTASKFLPQAIANARNVTLAAGSTVTADGTSGAGGNVVVWADGTTAVAGTISAKGQAGGFIETSGHVLDVAGARVDAGRGGTWLLDPVDLTIDATLAGTIAFTLNGGTNVIQETNDSGSGGSGDITVASAINWTTSASLTLSAYRNIAVNSNIASTAGGAVMLRADNSGTGAGTVSFGGGQVSTAGAVSIFYNPTGGDSTVNATQYTTGTRTDFSGNITGGGALTTYMLVNNVYDLQNVQNYLSGRYALGRDIDAAAAAAWNGGAGFSPIGNNSTATAAMRFTGTLDGQGHRISGLVVNRPANDYIGLFGYILTGGTVRNVGLVGVNVAGKTSVGALAGYNSGGSITQSYSTGTVSGTGNSVGGLVGQSSSASSSISHSYSVATVSGIGATSAIIGGLVGVNTGTIMQSYATGTVIGTGYAGGLVGFNSKTITQSYATGAVSSSGNTAGGLAGYNSGSITQAYANGPVSSGGNQAGGLVGGNAATGVITQAYATGTVGGAAFVGGLVGNNAGAVTQTYASGAVSGTTASVGGLIGNNPGTVTQSYWDTVASGRSVGIGSGSATGATGLTTGQMQDPANHTSTYAGWDFATVWSAPSAGYYPQHYGVNHVLRIDAADASRVYGDANPAFSYSHYGLHAGDSAAGLSASSAAPSANVGTYAIAGSGNVVGASGQIYRFIKGTGVLTVTPRPITVTADGKTKVENAADPALTWRLTSGNLAGGDTLAGSLARDPGETAAMYGIHRGTLAATPNYAFTFVDAYLRITPAPPRPPVSPIGSYVNPSVLAAPAPVAQPSPAPARSEDPAVGVRCNSGQCQAPPYFGSRDVGRWIRFDRVTNGPGPQR